LGTGAEGLLAPKGNAVKHFGATKLGFTISEGHEKRPDSSSTLTENTSVRKESGHVSQEAIRSICQEEAT
jgi:hypothetical protein